MKHFLCKIINNNHKANFFYKRKGLIDTILFVFKNINIKLFVNLLIEKKIVHLHPNFESKLY